MFDDPTGLFGYQNVLFSGSLSDSEHWSFWNFLGLGTGWKVLSGPSPSILECPDCPPWQKGTVQIIQPFLHPTPQGKWKGIPVKKPMNKEHISAPCLSFLSHVGLSHVSLSFLYSLCLWTRSDSPSEPSAHHQGRQELYLPIT